MGWLQTTQKKQNPKGTRGRHLGVRRSRQIYTAGPHQNQPHPPSYAPSGPRPGGSIVPSSLDSSLEKTILGFFFETRCRVSGCRWVVRRGSGVTKSPSDEAAEARCWCRLETRKGRDRVRKKEALRGGLDPSTRAAASHTSGWFLG